MRGRRLGVPWALAALAAAAGCDRGSEGGGERVTVQTVASLGSDVGKLCDVVVSAPGTPAGEAARKKVLEIRETAKRELAENAAARGTHASLVRVIDAYLARPDPCIKLSVVAVRIVSTLEEAPDGSGPTAKDASYARAVEGHTPSAQSLRARLVTAVKALIPSWSDESDSMLTDGRRITPRIEFVYTVWGGPRTLFRTGQGGTFFAPEPVADLKLVTSRDGYVFTDPLGSVHLPTDAEYERSVRLGDDLTPYDAVVAMSGRLSGKISAAMDRALGIRATAGERWAEHGRWQMTPVIETDGCDGGITFVPQTILIDSARTSLYVTEDYRAFLLERESDGSLSALHRFRHAKTCPGREDTERYAIRLTGPNRLEGKVWSIFKDEPCSESCTGVYRITATRVSDDARIPPPPPPADTSSD